MNQQQATEFIQQQLREGRNREEIIQLLSQQLAAPRDLLAKFVDKVAAQQPVQTQTPPAEPPIHEVQPILIQAAPPAAPAEQTPVQAPSPTGSEEPQPAPTLPPIVLAENKPFQSVAPIPTPQTDPAAAVPTAGAVTKQPSGADRLKDPKLVEFVVSQLKRQQRKSDIAMEVCERAGVDWKEAQRFVSQVSIEQSKRINRAKNLPILIFCGLFVFSGLIMLVLGVISLLPWLALFFGGPASPLTAADYDLRSTFYLLLGGVGFTLGGLVGFYLTLRPQME